MTIDSYQVSASWDVDVDAHHEMPDGSICKQTHRCTQGGNTVKNTQCAGSTKVTFKPKKGEYDPNLPLAAQQPDGEAEAFEDLADEDEDAFEVDDDEDMDAVIDRDEPTARPGVT